MTPIVKGSGKAGKRGRLGNTPPFPQSRPTAARHSLGASPAGSRSAQAQPARQGGRRSSGEGAGRGWWLWGWLGGWVEAIGRGMGYAGIAQKHYGNLQ